MKPQEAKPEPDPKSIAKKILRNDFDDQDQGFILMMIDFKERGMIKQSSVETFIEAYQDLNEDRIEENQDKMDPMHKRAFKRLTEERTETPLYDFQEGSQ